MQIHISTLDLVKGATKLVTSAGVSKIVKDIVENNTAPAETTMDIVKVWAGSFVLASMLTHHTSQHVDAQIEKAAAFADGVKIEMKKQRSAEEK